MRLPQPLLRGRLERRYKRFLADVTLESGETVTAHCANPGAMTGLADPGLDVWLSEANNPKRKLAYSWELTRIDGRFVGINTAAPNRIVAEALGAGAVGALAGYPEIRREVRYGEKSRVDFLLSGGGRPDCYVEVKNVHLMRRPGLAEFPDAATARGARHLADLAAMVAAGHRAAMLYVVQREDCRAFTLAGDIDPAYLKAYDAARAAGVEMLCYACRLSPQEIVLADALPVLSRCDVASKFDIE